MPDSLKLLPLYLLVLLKTPALRLMTSIRNLDLKVSTAMRQLGAPFAKMAYQLYPRVYRVTDVTAVVGHQHDNGGNHDDSDDGNDDNDDSDDDSDVDDDDDVDGDDAAAAAARRTQADATRGGTATHGVAPRVCGRGDDDGRDA